MTGPRWTVRGLLQNTNAGPSRATVSDTNRSFLIGLIIGVVMAVWKFATDDSELTSKLRIAAAIGVLVVVTIVAFLLVDTGFRLYRKVQRRREPRG